MSWTETGAAELPQLSESTELSEAPSYGEAGPMSEIVSPFAVAGYSGARTGRPLAAGGAGEWSETAGEWPGRSGGAFSGGSVAELTGEFSGEVTREVAGWVAGELAGAPEAAVTPFLHASAEQDRESVAGRLAAELVSGELGEALGELAQEWSALHAEVSSNGGLGVTTPALHEASAVLERQAEQLAAQVERYLGELGSQLGEHTASSIGEAELTSFLELAETTAETGSGGAGSGGPVQENFFGAIRRLAGRVVRGAVNLARSGLAAVGKLASAPLRFLFNRLARLVRPLLRRVLTWAIGRLPAPLQPLANRLRVRLFGAESELAGESVSAGEFELGESTVGEHGGWASGQELAAELAGELVWHGGTPAVAQAAELETEFAELVGQGMLAEDEAEVAQLESEFNAISAELEAAPGAAELDAARIVLVRELAELRDGESAGPAIERFLPAVLPALRIGVRLIGRRRVVNFLADLLAKLVRPLVGPQLATPLSQAVVDAGLRIFTLEASAEDRELAAPSAVASLLEDVVQRLAERGDEVFESVDRLHAETLEVFQEAVAHTVPGSLVRTDLAVRETAGADAAAWLLRPRVYWYRKYSRIFDVVITPQMAAAVTTFGGVRLSDALKAQGVRLPVRTRAHLYETLPGTYLSRISQLERSVPGMGPDGWQRFHPLSITAAGTLFGEPGLGKDVELRFTRDRSHVAAGQRVFYLQLPSTGRRRPTQAYATIDARPGKGVLRVFFYLSEHDAQEIASRVRQRNTTAFVLALRAAIRAAAYSLRSQPRSRVTVLRELAGEAPSAGAGAGALSSIATSILEKIVDRLVDAAIRLATDYAKIKGDEFVAAVDHPADGVTVVMSFPLPGLVALFSPIPGLGAVTALGSVLAGILTRKTGVRTLPGYHRF